MAIRQNTFLLKRSNVSGKIPSAGNLLLGELALNTADAILYTSGTTANSILPIGWDRVSITGDTMTGTLYVPTISATTYQNLPIDVTVTGGTYTAGTATFTNNTGGTFTVTGFTGLITTRDTGLTYTNSISLTTPTQYEYISAKFLKNNIIKDVFSVEEKFDLRLIQPITAFTSDAIVGKSFYAQDTMRNCLLTNGNFVLAYRTNTNTLKIELFSGETYTRIGTGKTVTTTLGLAYEMPFDLTGIKGSNNFVVTWRDTTASNLGRFAIYNGSGDVVKSATTFNSSCGGYLGVDSFSDGNFVIVFKDTTSKYVIYNSGGTVVESVTNTSGTGTGNANDVCVLTNDYFVIVNEGATNSGRYVVYDKSTNPSTVKVAYTTYSTNIYGLYVPNEVHPLSNKGFAIYFNDQASTNVQLVSTYQYVSNTNWVNTSTYQPNVQYLADLYAAWADSDINQELLLVGYPTNNVNTSYAPAINVMEGDNATTLNYGEQKLYIPFPNRIPINGTVRGMILKDKRILIYWSDSTDSDKGKFVVYQIAHFKISVDGNTITLKNNTGITQNVLLSATFK